MGGVHPSSTTLSIHFSGEQKGMASLIQKDSRASSRQIRPSYLNSETSPPLAIVNDDAHDSRHRRSSSSGLLSPFADPSLRPAPLRIFVTARSPGQAHSPSSSGVSASPYGDASLPVMNEISGKHTQLTTATVCRTSSARSRGLSSPSAATAFIAARGSLSHSLEPRQASTAMSMGSEEVVLSALPQEALPRRKGSSVVANKVTHFEMAEFAAGCECTCAHQCVGTSRKIAAAAVVSDPDGGVIDAPGTTAGTG